MIAWFLHISFILTFAFVINEYGDILLSLFAQCSLLISLKTKNSEIRKKTLVKKG